MLKKVFFLIITLLCINFSAQNNDGNRIKYLDSVSKYLDISYDIPFPEKRIKYLDKAYSFAKELSVDSLFIKISSDIAYYNILLENKDNFEKSNSALFNFFETKRDSSALGLYYQNKGYYFNNNSSIDSAYYYFNKAKNIFISSKVKFLKVVYVELLNVTFFASDYLETEKLAIEILEHKNFIKEYKTLGRAYTFLGLVSSELQDFETSLKYHLQGLDVIKNIKDVKRRNIEKALHTNNIGLMYIHQEKFKMALPYFEKALKLDPDLKKNDAEMYAIIKGNIGICQIETGKRKEAIDSFNEGLKTGEKLKNSYIQTFILLEFALLYKNEKNPIKAKYYIDRTLVLVEKSHFKKIETLLLAAEIYSGKKSIEFYEAYIELQEKIDNKEQKVKNKFARIRFETDKKEEENTFLKQESLLTKAKIKNEQNKSKITGLIALFSMLITLFVYLFYHSRQKIYTYKSNLEKAQVREQERKEIAISLHDKVVGDLRLIYERALNSKVDNIAEPLLKVNSQIRNLSHQLISVDFNEVAFKDQIINLLGDYFSPKFKIKVKNLDKIDWLLVDTQIKRVLYLVIRESIQNSNKHALASEILIDFKNKNKSLQLSIKDNGKGFDVSSPRYGLGLKNQRKRVEELSGTFNLESIINVGTTTKVEIPLRA
jgi:signal transduction histidine kinase